MRVVNGVLIILLATVLCSKQAQGQIRSRSFDLGIDGFYNTSSLVVTLGGGSANGGLKRAGFNGQLGYFLFDNFSFGIRYFRSYDNFWVEGQHFNQNTGQYEPFRQIDDAYIVGGYARYYVDFSNSIAVFLHGEVGMGKELVTYTSEDSTGGVMTNEFNRDVSDLGVSLGIALRPSPNVGLELQIMRRFVQEAYDPRVGSTGLTQVEAYSGYELRIGARINVDLIATFIRKGAPRIRPL